MMWWNIDCFNQVQQEPSAPPLRAETGHNTSWMFLWPKDPQPCALTGENLYYRKGTYF